MTNATFDSTTFEIIDFWAEPSVQTVKEEVVEVKKITKHYACIDPIVLMMFIASALEQGLITDEACKDLNPNKLFENFREPGHPVYAILQALLGISLLTASQTFKSLVQYMKDNNEEFEAATYDHAYRLAESMKEVYTLEEFDEDKIRQISVKADYIRHNQFLKYDEKSYQELVKEINYMFMTCNAKFVVIVTKEVEDNIAYISEIKPGFSHFNTYSTAQMIPFVVSYMDKFGKVPYDVNEFSLFVQQTLIANHSSK
jgi:hypothetical protein